MLLAVTLVTFVMVLSSMGLLASGARAPTPATSGASASVVPAVSAHPAAPKPSEPSVLQTSGLTAPPTTATVAPTEGVNPAVALAKQLIAEKKINPSSVFFPATPNPNVAPGGLITPSAYTTNPSPMGISDLGQSSSGPYVYNTSSFEASISLNSFQDYNPGYAGWVAPPNYMTWQLNTVTVNVSYPGGTDGVFWIQNVVHFNGTSLQFENNIWNMTSATTGLNPGTLLTYSGTLVPGAYYYVYGPTYQVTYPFTLDLFNNITSAGGHPGVYFNYTLTNTTTGGHTGSFDYVTFNGTASHSAPPSFEVNGKKNNPLGLYWDAELIFGGNGGGANAVITNLSGTSTLQYWSATAGAYENVRAAYDYGVNTGETADGAAFAYQGTTELLSQGPSFLYGLWNTSNSTWGPAARPGWINVDLNGMPNDGFVFATNQSSLNFIRGPTGNLSYAPSDVNGVTITHLPPAWSSDPYVFRAYANGYGWGNFTVLDNATGTETFSLTARAGAFYTPVYLSTTAQVASFGAAGITGVTYSSVHNALWVNSSVVSLGVPFNLLNDFRFPEFMIFAALNLSVNVSLNHFIQNPTTFQYYKYNSVRVTPYYIGLTQGYFFNFGTGVFTVTNTTVTGSAYLTHDASFTPLAAVEFWQTTDSSAGWITTGQDSFGVDVENSTYATLWNITGQSGANAVAVLYSEGVLIENVVANGTDGGGGVAGVTPVPTWGVYLSYDLEVGIEGLTASNGSVLLFDNGTNLLFVLDVRAVNNLIGDPADGEFGFPALIVGGIDIELENWYLANCSSPDYGIGIAVDLEEVQDVIVNNFTVSGFVPGSSPQAAILGLNFDGLGGLFGLTGFTTFFVAAVNVTNLSAFDGAVGVFAYRAEFVNESNIDAVGSTAALVTVDFYTISQWNVSVGSDSVAVLTEGGQFLNIWNVTSGQDAVGVYTVEATDVNVWNVTSTSTSLGSPYVTNAFILHNPNAAVASFEDSNLVENNISATDYNFGVWDNDTSTLSVTGATIWGAADGLLLNTTNVATVSQVFVYSGTLGADFVSANSVMVAASTFEGASSYGVDVTGGSSLIFYGDNFVANNGASTDGTFSAAHVQAAVSGSSVGVEFDYLGIGNYWSDWSGTGSYVINGSVSDTAPYALFVSNWLEFNETGLPAGTVWGFTLGTAVYSTGVPLVYIPSWSLENSTIGFVVNPPSGYSPSPASGNVVYDTQVNQTVTISFAQAHYNVVFEETGLPAGTSWGVTFNSTANSALAPASITYSVYDGTYSYTVGTVPEYTALPSSGSVTVSGGDKIVTIAFTHVPVYYTVTFSESGLPSGTNWSVTLDATTQTGSGNLEFSVLNGTFSYTIPNTGGYSATPSEGTVTVAGSAQTVSTVFSTTPVSEYLVNFVETGLPAGTNWSVTIGVATHYSDGTTSVAFNEANGTYSYTVNAVSGFKIEQATGSVQVAGQAQSVTVTFAAAPLSYTITFTETGLPSGTNWSVSIGTTTHYSNGGTSVTFSEANGTYDYSIGSVSGYTASPSSSSVTLSGASTGVTIAFSSSSTSSSSSGLSTLDWAIIGIVIAIIVIALIVALVMRGRGGSGTPATTDTTTTTTSETTSTPAPWSEESPPGSSP